MKRLHEFMILISVLMCCSSYSVLSSQVYQEKEDDKTLSPYFFVRSDDPNTDQLPLMVNSADVNIAGVIADIHVTQIYKNEGKNPLEAIYIFPASTRAAVYNMQMTIGDRTITAKIAKRAEAREEYEQARADGKSASLLEQQRPNVFQMNVANIMPGDRIKVDLYYTELLVPTDNEYEFVYPTVVGPRYSNMLQNEALPSDKWVKNPYLHEGENPPYDFDLKISLSAGMPVQEIVCTSHKVNIDYKNKATANISLLPSDKNGGNHDFIIKYRLAGNKIDSGLLLYKGENENFFLTMMQPPNRIDLDQIPFREYIFIVDVSGSMHGFPLDISKKLLKDLIHNLRPEDKFNLVLFAAGSRIMSEHSVSATEENIRQAIHIIDSERGSGGTELLPALKRALALPKTEGNSRSIIIVTDGYVHVEKEAFDVIRTNLGKANMFAFGIGSSVNRYLIEGMARVGMGESFIITNASEATAKAVKFRKYIQSPVLTGIEVTFDGFKAYDVEPTSYPDVLAERPIIIFGKWRDQAKGEIVLRGYTGASKKYIAKLDIGAANSLPTNAALRYLWARSRIGLLADYVKISDKDELVEEITNLGLKYNLLTDYTSFIAVDSEIRNLDGKIATINQPLPLPQGVSDYALSGRGIATTAYRKSIAQPSEPLGVLNTVGRSPKVEEKAAENVSVTVSLGSLTIEKESHRKAVSDLIRNNLHKIKACLNNRAQYFIGQNSTAKIKVKIVITKKGLVNIVSIISNELRDNSIDKCIKEEIKNWKFGTFKDAENITVTCQFFITT